MEHRSRDLLRRNWPGPKAAPEYIGATNRASRRRARLARYDELIADTVAEEERAAAELDRVAALLDDFRRARRELPDTRPVARAAEAAGLDAALLARARGLGRARPQGPRHRDSRAGRPGQASRGRPPPSAGANADSSTCAV